MLPRLGTTRFSFLLRSLLTIRSSVTLSLFSDSPASSPSRPCTTAVWHIECSGTLPLRLLMKREPCNVRPTLRVTAHDELGDLRLLCHTPHLCALMLRHSCHLATPGRLMLHGITMPLGRWRFPGSCHPPPCRQPPCRLPGTTLGAPTTGTLGSPPRPTGPRPRPPPLWRGRARAQGATLRQSPHEKETF